MEGEGEEEGGRYDAKPSQSLSTSVTRRRVAVVRVATATVNTIELTIAKAKGGGQAATTGKPAKREQPLLYSGLVDHLRDRYDT